MKQTELPRLLWLGDSIFVHYRPYLLRFLEGVAEIETRNGYREALENLDHPRGTNCGDSSMVLAFLQHVLAKPEFKARCLVINCGLHDIKTEPGSSRCQVSLAEYEENLMAILRLRREYGLSLVWIATTPVVDARHQKHCPEVHRHERDVLAYNAAAEKLMRADGVPVLDLHRFTSCLEGELYIDHVHYTEEVRALQAAFLSGHMERIFEGKESAVAQPDAVGEGCEAQRIVLLGDSTVAKLPADSGIRGWGEALHHSLPGWEVVNLAVSGASTKSFLDRDEYAQAQSTPAAYWLIQFGHNDMKEYDPARFTDADGAYRENLRRMVADARATGARAVLVTSPHRLRYDAAGVPTDELLPYVKAVRAVGAELAVPVIDLYAMSEDLLCGFGPEHSGWITATDKDDFAHFTPCGAQVIAALVAKELHALIAAGK